MCTTPAIPLLGIYAKEIRKTAWKCNYQNIPDSVVYINKSQITYVLLYFVLIDWLID